MTLLTVVPFIEDEASIKAVPAGSLEPNLLPHYARFFSYQNYNPGESLSSWITRLASANRISRKSIWTESGITIHPQDADLHLVPDQWPAIERLLKSSAEKLLTYDARVIISALYNDPIVKDFIKHKLKYVFRICPYCLSEGEPYFRAKWRLNFYCMCEKHHVWMSDRCDCGQPINFNKMRERGRHDPYHYYCFCSRCARDLRHQKRPPFPNGGEWLQSTQAPLWAYCVKNSTGSHQITPNP